MLAVFLVIVLLLLVNAFYVAAEFAMVGVRLTRVEQLAAQGSRLAAALVPVLGDTRRLDRQIAACQIGITLSSLILGAFGQATVGLALGELLSAHTTLHPAGAYALSATIALLALTSVQVVLGELMPKTVALQYPVGTALYTYFPLRWSELLLTPFIFLLNGSGALVLRLLGLGGDDTGNRHVHSPEEIDMLIRESRKGGLLAPRESKRLREALQLGRHKARQLMVPRRRIFSLDLNTPREQLLAQITASPYTRIPVHQGNPEELRVYLHIKDVAAAAAGDTPLPPLQELTRPLLVLPSSLTIDRALGQLRDQRARIALLVDEYGETAGLLSLEDIVRELLGQLSDEFKTVPDLAPRALSNGQWRLPGRLPLDEAREWAASTGQGVLDDWASSKAETLAGWLLEQLDAIPAGKCCLQAGNLRFEIEALEGASIASVLARPRAGDGDA